jgi:hypothetical protein
VGDADTIQMIDVATHEIVATLPSGPDPELFTQDPSRQDSVRGEPTDANTVTISDPGEAGAAQAEVQVASSPKAWASVPNGKILVNTSENDQYGAFHSIPRRVRS